MRISINIAHSARPEGATDAAEQLEQIITAADEIGLDTVWVADHLLHADEDGAAEGPAGLAPAGAAEDTDGGADEAVLEACATLGFLATRSERVRLGAMASAVGYRAPGLLIQAVTTLDVLSGGRARLGVGVSRPQPGPAAADRRPPSPAEQFERVEDLLRLAHDRWAADESPLRDAHGAPARWYPGPPALGRPHPPVLIEGSGEARMLPLVARYADACNLLDVPQGGAAFRGKLDVLAVHCRKAGRSLSEIDVSVGVRMRPDESADELVAQCRHFADLGVGHLVLTPQVPWTGAALSALAAAVPAARRLGHEPEAAQGITYADPYRVPAASIPV